MAITVPGVGPNALPGVIEQINFATGQLSQGTAQYAAIILANMNQDGSGSAFAGIDGYNIYGPDTNITMQSVQDAINLFGGGSPCALAVGDFFTLNPSTPLYVLPVRQPVGGNPATWVLTLTTSTLTNGAVSLQIGPDAPIVTSVNGSTDTPTTIAANMANNVNATNLLPVVATSNAGVLTLTSKVVGARQNWLIAQAKIISGSGLTLSNLQATQFSGGTGSDSADLQACLNSLAVNGLRYYDYIVESGADSVDAVGFEAAATQVVALAGYPSLLRQRLVGGSTDTFGNTTTVSTAVNQPRVEIVWLPASQTVPLRLAARASAAYMLQEIPPLGPRGVNFDSFGSTPLSFANWNVPAPLNGSSPSAITQLNATLTGLTPLAVQKGGRTCIVKRVTSRFFTNGAGTFDGRITDGGKVTICDQFTDDLKAQLVATFPDCLLADDPPPGSPPVGPGIATPGLVRNVCQTVIKTYAARNLINGPVTLQNLVVEVDDIVPTRMDIQVALFTNNLLHTILLVVNQAQ